MTRLRFLLILICLGLLAGACRPPAAVPTRAATAAAPSLATPAAPPTPPVALPTTLLLPTLSATVASSATTAPTAATPSPAPTTATATTTVPPSPTPCAEPGRVEQGAVDSAVAEQPMRYRIYLPPCYGQEGHAYPTLYMFGGNIHDETIWDNLGLDEAAEGLIQAGTIPPLLIVMPDNGWLANTTTSGPNSYEGFVINELIPHIEATYRAQPTREGRAVGGLSRGGYWSLMMAFRRPDLFRSVGAHSPALIDSHAGPAEDPVVTGAVNDLGDLRIRVDIGERDPYLPKALPLHEALTAAGVAHEWWVNQGTHEEAYWRGNLGQYLAWYSAGWPINPEDPATAASIGNVPPDPPTPGPEPTSLPESLEGAIPVTNEIEALERAITLDSEWATRATPLTVEALLANPDSYIVEQYSTWQEASDLYGFGTLAESPTATEPVWVVILKGDVIVHTMGGSQDTDGITLIIAQNTGYLLSMATGVLQKRVSPL